MATTNNRTTGGNERDLTANRTEQISSVPNDLPDSPRDEERLRPEETVIDLPDVKDIPGQEFVHTTPLGEMADTTISSADEEGDRVFELEENEEEGQVDYVMGTEADVNRDEKRALEDEQYLPTHDEDHLRNAHMDDVDFQGEALNEKGFGSQLSGKDLDVPGEELDNRNENIGEEDEENNDYSLGASESDFLSEATP